MRYRRVIAVALVLPALASCSRKDAPVAPIAKGRAKDSDTVSASCDMSLSSLRRLHSELLANRSEYRILADYDRSSYCAKAVAIVHDQKTKGRAVVLQLSTKGCANRSATPRPNTTVIDVSDVNGKYEVYGRVVSPQQTERDRLARLVVECFGKQTDNPRIEPDAAGDAQGREE